MTIPPARRRWRVPVSALVAGAVSAGVLAAVAGPSASAATAVAPRTPYVQANCPDTVPVYPTATKSGYYGVPIASKILDGTLRIGRIVETTGIRASICGLLRFPQLTATVPAVACNAATEATGCISFATATTTIDGLVDLPTTFTPGTTTVSVGHQAAANGGLEINITTQVTTHVHVASLGVDCAVGPITVNLTTAQSGPLSGAAVTGPLTLATAKVVGASFAVPAAHPDITCPGSILPATNKLVGLPTAPGTAQLMAPLTLANSLS